MPTLNVAGWWDQEDFYGPITHLRARSRKYDTEASQLSRRRPVESRRMEPRRRRIARRHRFRQRHGALFPRQIEAPWFAYWLKDKGQLPLEGDHLSKPAANEWRALRFLAAHARRRNAQTLFPRRASSRSTLRTAGRPTLSTPTSAIPRIPFRIATVRSTRLIPATSEVVDAGWWRTSASSTTGPTC